MEHVPASPGAKSRPIKDDLDSNIEALSTADLYNLYLLQAMLARTRIQAALRVVGIKDREDARAAWGGLVFYKEGVADAVLYQSSTDVPDNALVYTPSAKAVTDGRDALCRFIAHFEKESNAPRAGPTPEESRRRTGQHRLPHPDQPLRAGLLRRLRQPQRRRRLAGLLRVPRMEVGAWHDFAGNKEADIAGHREEGHRYPHLRRCAILFRIGRDLIPLTEGKATPELTERLVLEMLTPSQIAEFRRLLDYDLMISDGQGRYRVNISYNDRAVGAVIRILPEQARTIDELALPQAVREMATATKGILLITGATSQGKTTTMLAIIHEINLTQRKHVITIEDPIETIHTPVGSIVRQREVGRDTKTFASGLRAALRQDPDVVAIGEMRDYETIKIALTAAETGTLVLSTLHIISIDKLIERLLSYGPADEQDHLRYLMAGAWWG